MRIELIGMILFVAACDDGSDGASSEEVAALGQKLDALTTRVSTLEAELAGARSDLAAANATLQAQAATVSAAEELLAVMSVDADGDVLIEDANLKVRSGGGTTDAAVNGKGNVIIGYDEQNA